MPGVLAASATSKNSPASSSHVAKRAAWCTRSTPTAPYPPPVAKAKKPKLTSPPQNAEGKQKAKPARKRDFLAACETSEKTLKALQFNASTADDALQVYVHSVADPAIYNALKDASDRAHAAVALFSAQGAEA